MAKTTQQRPANKQSQKTAKNRSEKSTNKAKEEFESKVIPFTNIRSPFPYGGEGFAGPHKHLEKLGETFTLGDEADHRLRATIAKLTGGLSPASLLMSYYDWAIHLASMPAKQQYLMRDAFEKYEMYVTYVFHEAFNLDCRKCIEAEDSDHRFRAEEWGNFPFVAYSQGFLLMQDWWQLATSGIKGVSRHHEDIVQFTTRQWLDMVSPTNFPATNPTVLKTTMAENGQNFVKGAQNLAEDMKRHFNGEPPRGMDKFIVGRDLATAKGKVVFRNHLFELIQYSPTTDKVIAEPLLMIPAWIMKFYILDLSPHNSMVQYLVDKGHTVFMISWKNPDEKDANLGMNDYLEDGVMKAVDAVSTLSQGQKMHAVGYCIGGTLLSMAAAAMERDQDYRFKTLSFFTTQIDFEEAGELMLFVDESELAFLEELMKEQGYLRKEQLSGAFNMLRSKDLIWSEMVEQYMLGEKKDIFDLMAWNYDATRLPARMHSEYLRSFYLNNDLAENRYRVADDVISMRDIDLPLFSVATQKDHIAPWKSVYKVHDLLRTDITFLLTSGGHNAGVISEPGHKGRTYQIREHEPREKYISPEDWVGLTEVKEGSWWPEWQKWLENHSGEKTGPPPMGNEDKGYKVLGDAPGTYVYVR